MASAYKIFLMVCFFAAVSSISGLDIRDCGSKRGKFNKIAISGCDLSQDVCLLHRGSNASIAIDFVPSENASAVKTIIHGIIDYIPVPFPLNNPDACVDSGIQCPLKTGTAYEYKALLQVLKSYPRVSLKVKWELQDENGDDIVCLLVPAKVV